LKAVFDTDLLVRRKKRAIRTATPGADFLMQRTVDDLEERLSTVKRQFERAATLFCGTGTADEALRRSGKVSEVVRVEADYGLRRRTGEFVANPETVPLPPASIDLAVSLLSLHEVNDVPGMLVQIRRALKPDGLFLGALAGSATLFELREALLAAESEIYGGVSPRVPPFVDVRDAGGLLQRAGFALPVTDSEQIIVRYDNLFDLMRDLRAMGATNVMLARSRKPVSKRFFLRAAELYADRFSDADGRIRATFDFVWLSGWAPAPSQPQPLRPGSGRVSLAKALATDGDGHEEK
jgi:SAM-dependent methyltransferase